MTSELIIAIKILGVWCLVALLVTLGWSAWRRSTPYVRGEDW